MNAAITPTRITVVATLMVTCLLGCGPSTESGGSQEMGSQLLSLRNVPASYWDALSRKRIFFGHKSVGRNILDGVADLMREHPEIKLSVVEGSRVELLAQPALAHESVGRNKDPLSKIQEFQRLMDEGLGDKVDVALFKFCFVDIESQSDVEGIFKMYIDAMTDLQLRYPDIVFLHATVPLCSRPVTAKEKLRRLGMRVRGKPDVVEHNRKRQQYNDLLRQRFPPEEIFDLALAEAVGPDGALEISGAAPDGVTMLCPEYTDDSGHLNEIGRRHVAEQFLITLANAGQ